MQEQQHDAFSPQSSSSSSSAGGGSSPFSGRSCAGNLQSPPPPLPLHLLQQQQQQQIQQQQQELGYDELQMPSLYYHEPLQPVVTGVVARPFRMRVEPKVVIFQVRRHYRFKVLLLA